MAQDNPFAEFVPQQEDNPFADFLPAKKKLGDSSLPNYLARKPAVVSGGYIPDGIIQPSQYVPSASIPVATPLDDKMQAVRDWRFDPVSGKERATEVTSGAGSFGDPFIISDPSLFEDAYKSAPNGAVFKTPDGEIVERKASLGEMLAEPFQSGLEALVGGTQRLAGDFLNIPQTIRDMTHPNYRQRQAGYSDSVLPEYPMIDLLDELLPMSYGDPLVRGADYMLESANQRMTNVTAGTTPLRGSLGEMTDQVISDPENVARQYGPQVVRSLPTMLGAMTGNPAAAAGIAGASTGVETYGQDRLQGMDIGTSAQDAGVQAIIETLAEKLPLDAVFKPSTNPIAKALRVAGTETASEGLTGPSQYAASQAVQGNEIDPEQLQNSFVDSLAAGLGMSGPMASVGAAVDVNAKEKSSIQSDTTKPILPEKAPSPPVGEATADQSQPSKAMSPSQVEPTADLDAALAALPKENQNETGRNVTTESAPAGNPAPTNSEAPSSAPEYTAPTEAKPSIPEPTAGNAASESVLPKQSAEGVNRLAELETKSDTQDLSPDESVEYAKLLKQDRIAGKVGGRVMPGVKNSTAYTQAKDAGQLKPVQTFLDADNFKRINDELNHDAGDEAIAQIGQALFDELGEGNVFHRSGDEFIVQGDDPAVIDAAMTRARDRLSKAKLQVTLPDGTVIERTGIGFSYGSGKDITEAENAQRTDKENRAAAGLRTERRADSRRVDSGTDQAPVAGRPQESQSANYSTAKSGRRYVQKLIKGKPVTRPGKNGKPVRVTVPVLDYKSDNLLHWLAAAGGINYANVSKQIGIDKALFKDRLNRPFDRIDFPVLRKNGGLTLDEIYDKMKEDGWLLPDSETGQSRDDAGNMEDMLSNALAGRSVLHPYESRGERGLAQESANQEAPSNFMTADEDAQAEGFADDVERQHFQAYVSRQLDQYPVIDPDTYQEMLDEIYNEAGYEPNTDGKSDSQANRSRVAEETQGLFSKATPQEAVESERRKRDAERDGRNGSGRTDMLSGDGELFAGNAPEQGSFASKVESTNDMFVKTRGDQQEAAREKQSASTTKGNDESSVPPRSDATPELTRRGKYEVDALVRRYGGSVLADRIARDFREKDTAQLVGQIIKSAADLAAVADVYRNPIFETLRYIFVDANGEVVAETAVSSRMPSSAMAFPTDEMQDGPAWIQREGRSYVAAGFWMVHNHPSGDPTPSMADVHLTRHIADNSGKVKFMGHVVINHTKYASIEADGSRSVREITRPEKTDPLVSERGIIGQPAANPEVAAYIGAQYMKMIERGSIALITLDSKAKVSLATAIPEKMLTDKRGLALAKRIGFRGAGSVQIAVLPEDLANFYEARLLKALATGVIVDVVSVAQDGKATSWVDSRKASGDYLSTLIGRGGRDQRGAVVYEDTTPYADQTETPAFKKWFGDSKVVDADGKPLVVYHGSPDARFVAEDGIFKSQKERIGFGYAQGAHWFAASPRVAKTYADPIRAFDYQNAEEGIVSAYLKMERPLIVNAGGAKWRDAQKRGKTSDVIEEARSAGNDGVIIRNVRDDYQTNVVKGDAPTDTYVVFESTQIKSATGNSGAFDAENPSIVRSPITPYEAGNKAEAKRNEAAQTLPVDRGTVGWNYDTGVWEGRTGQLNRARAALQDKMLAWRDVQNQIESKLGEALPDAQNVYRMETLMHGRVSEAINQVEQSQIIPLIDAMKSAKVTNAQFEEYLYARHAIERNRQVASINPKMPDGGSGMSDAQAQAILDKADKAKLESLAKRVDAITRATRKRLLDSGLITQEQHDGMAEQYKAYVPLRGKKTTETDFEAGGNGAGRGIDSRSQPVKGALGRGTGNLAENILAEIIGDAHRSVIVAEKARVGRAVMRLVLANPNPNLWTIEPVQTERKLDANGEVYDAVINDWSDPSIVAVRHKGKLYKVEIQSQPLAQALNNVGVDQLGMATKVAGTINRYFSAVLTKYNPAFVPVNATRDALFGLTGLAVEKGELAALDAAIHYPQAAFASFQQARNKSGTGEWAKWADEFAQAGGKTGYVAMPSVEDLARQIGNGSLSSYSPSGLTKAARTITDAVGVMNDAVENALRLSAFVTLRKRGESTEKAAEYAKNMTVNFNRKGFDGSKLNAWLLFYNASIQGAHRTSKILRKPKAYAYLGTLAAIQVVATMFAMGLKGDDDEPLWNKVPDHVKRRNIVIVTPDSGVITIPMPYGFNLFPYIAGRISGALMNKEAKPEDSAASIAGDVMSAATESFSPVPLDDGALGLLPTVLRIPVNLQTNRNDFGQEIRKENPYSKFDVPRASMGKPDTLEVFKMASTGLNRLGGGDEYTPPPMSWLDVAPEDIQYLLTTLTGGTGKFVVDVASVGQKLAGPEPVKMSDIPITKRFVSKIDEQAAQQAMFYNRAETINRSLEKVRDHFERTGDLESTKKMLASFPELKGAAIKVRKKEGEKGQPAGSAFVTDGRIAIKVTDELSVFGLYKSGEKMITSINEARRNVYNKAPATILPTKETRERDKAMAELKSQREVYQKRFNAAWQRDVVGSAED